MKHYFEQGKSKACKVGAVAITSGRNLPLVFKPGGGLPLDYAQDKRFAPPTLPVLHCIFLVDAYFRAC